MNWLGLGILGIVLAVLALPLLLDRRKGLPDQSRAPGEMIALPKGATHALWHGGARGPVIVAVHGLTTPSPVWDKLAEGLVALGYRVLTYDLYGRGYSDNAHGDQTPDFHVAQLKGVLDHYGLAEDITLLGYSMGGMIVTAFADAYPEQVKRVILIAPAGMAVNEDAQARFARQTPVLGDWLFAMFAAKKMRAGTSTMSDSEVPGLSEIAAGEYDRRGYIGAVFSSLRHTVHLSQEAQHRRLAATQIPVIAIWGAEDQTIPLRSLGMLSTWNRRAKQEVVAGAGHGLPHTHATQVTTLLRDMLREDWE